MTFMSITVYEQTQKEIECAYLEKDKAKIEKETLNVLNFVIIMFINKFEERINKSIFDPDDFQLNEEYLLSQENHQELKQWVNRLSLMEFPINDEEFGKLTIELEQWYYKIGSKNLKIYYNENYLLTPKEAANMLSVSTVLHLLHIIITFRETEEREKKIGMFGHWKRYLNLLLITFSLEKNINLENTSKGICSLGVFYFSLILRNLCRIEHFPPRNSQIPPLVVSIISF